MQGKVSTKGITYHYGTMSHIKFPKSNSLLDISEVHL
jgi:hypothetical protein